MYFQVIFNDWVIYMHNCWIVKKVISLFVARSTDTIMLFFQNDDKVFAINIAMLNQICEKKVDIHMTPDVMFNLRTL